MNIKEKFPNLFKTLAKQYGTRQAISMIKETGLTSKMMDDKYPTRCFPFANSRQGHEYWAKVTDKVGGWPGGGRL